MEIYKGKIGVSAVFSSNIGHIGIFYTVYAHCHIAEEIVCPEGSWWV